MIKKALHESNKKLTVRFTTGTTDNLITLLTKNIQLLHISGHGQINHLILEDSYGDIDILSSEKLKRLLIVGGNQLQFVMISQCHSKAAAQAFYDAGIKHVVAVHQDSKILDRTARIFTKHMYIALFNNNTIQDSFNKGISAIIALNNTEYDDESSKFILFSKNPQDVLFKNIATGSWLDLTLKLPYNNIPALPTYYRGRSNCCFRCVIGMFKPTICRLLMISGHIGIGKSILAQAVNHHICKRRKFEHGFLYITCNHQIEDVYNITSYIVNILLQINYPYFKSYWQLEQKTEHLNQQEQFNVLLHFLKDKNMLITLDNCDYLIQNHLQHRIFIKYIKIFLQTCPEISFILTSCVPGLSSIAGIGMRMVVLRSLSKRDIIIIFISQCPRPLNKKDFPKELEITNIIQHPIFEYLPRNPLIISLLASLLNIYNLMEIFLLKDTDLLYYDETLNISISYNELLNRNNDTNAIQTINKIKKLIQKIGKF